ncbi:MAG: pseudouridine synthase [Candidatus Woesearchaeota archaeon]
MHRVQKILSQRGYCSRRKAEELIDEGRVAVNGKIITIGDKAGEEDEIRVDDKPVSSQKRVYIKLNKPAGCVTALRDEKKPTVMDYIDLKERVFPVGRLDYNTSGLLILTNDGDFANRVMHPRYETKKRYEVTPNKPLTEDDIARIEKGINIEGKRTTPATVKKKGDVYEIIIHEGRNRIIRRMLHACGYSVKKLHRTQIGKIGLGNLATGEYAHLTKKEISEFK